MKNIEVYTLAEMEDRFPEAYEKIAERYRDEAQYHDLPWIEEYMDSLHALCDAANVRLRDWCIGMWASQSYIRVDVPDTEGETDMEYFEREVLAPKFTTNSEGEYTFPGDCPFTGFSADDTLAESVWEDLHAGCTLEEAFRNLSTTLSGLLETEYEATMTDEAMHEAWNYRYFTEDGTEV
jgi:hypothetical protein